MKGRLEEFRSQGPLTGQTGADTRARDRDDLELRKICEFPRIRACCAQREPSGTSVIQYPCATQHLRKPSAFVCSLQDWRGCPRDGLSLHRTREYDCDVRNLRVSHTRPRRGSNADIDPHAVQPKEHGETPIQQHRADRLRNQVRCIFRQHPQGAALA